ncbi:hypothetical protein [Paludisphaera borealis]|uniref:hypothetical protein n=1 Tax=Paludisphaera borealis TaxID=1387353 RepID=UPI0009707C03|nr:hypothetical protein [Paludisphaera borealis]
MKAIRRTQLRSPNPAGPKPGTNESLAVGWTIGIPLLEIRGGRVHRAELLPSSAGVSADLRLAAAPPGR